MKKDNLIDIVITWVDGNDPNWLKEFNKYSSNTSGDKSDCRYRDFDFLKYWFRTIEQNASWVRKIHFVTWGHLPEWLDVNNPKLNIVKHSDFIPDDYLPTFNSCVIELNLYRIEGLSNQFIYFNDDMFLMKQKCFEDFFKNEKPIDLPIFEKLNYHGQFSLTHFRNSILIQNNFNRKIVFFNDWNNWLNINYSPRQILKNIYALFSFGTLNIRAPHFAMSLLKKDFINIWEKEKFYLEKACKDRFRNYNSINPYVIRMWNICSNEFIVRKRKMNNKSANLKDSIEDNIDVIKYIFTNEFDLVCFNDNITDHNVFIETKDFLNAYFEKYYPTKSSFEKYD